MSRQSFTFLMRLFSLLPFSVTICGCAKPAPGIVIGKVTVDDRLIDGGTIFLVSPTGEAPISATVQTDGTYRVENVPPGQYLISLADPRDATDSEQGQIQKRMGQQIESGIAVVPPPALVPTKVQRIPSQYGDPSTSGLSVKVQSLNDGETRFDIALTNKKQ